MEVDSCPEGAADPLEHGAQPLPVRCGRGLQAHLRGLHGRDLQGCQLARARLHRREVEQPQVVAVLVVVPDALVVVDAVAAAVEDELAPEHLDRARVVRGVTVDQVGPAVDQPVGEADLAGAHAIPPVRSPVDGDHSEVTGPLFGPDPAGDIVGGGVGQIRQHVDAGPVPGGGPVGRDPAGTGAARQHDDTAAARHRDGYRPPRLLAVPPGPCRAQPGFGQGFQGVLQAAAAEVEHVVVRQRAHVRPDGGHAGQVARAHPVVNGLARREFGVAGDAGLQVDYPDIGGDLAEDRQRVPHGQPKGAGRGILPLARSAHRT